MRTRRHIRTTWSPMLLALSTASACQKDDPAPTAAASSAGATATAHGATDTVANVSPLTTAAVAPSSAPRTTNSPRPDSFATAAKAEVKGAVGLGCEAKSTGDWLELVCRKKNATGGKPIRAVFATAAEAMTSRGEASDGTAPSAAVTAKAPDIPPDAPAPATTGGEGARAQDPELLARAVEPNASGDLTVVVPLGGATPTTVRIEWSDVTFDLVVDGAKAELARPENLALRRACAALQKDSDGVVERAERGSSGLTKADVARLPRFGRCQLSGSGAWALELTGLEATGDGAERQVVARTMAVRLDEQGKAERLEHDAFRFAPGGLELPMLMIFDFDGDGTHELIVRHSVTKRAPSATGSSPSATRAVFGFVDGRVVHYAKAPALQPGGIEVEQLDFDMRPDLADYGPFIAWLGTDCGAKTCPGRVTGPRFFHHSLADGGFSPSDAAAKTALGRACSKKPDRIVASTGDGANVKTSALNVACARVHGIESAGIVRELEQEATRLCGGATTCAVLDTLVAWAKQTPPQTL